MTRSTRTVAERNKETVLELYDAVRRMDVETFLASCDPAMEIHEAVSIAEVRIFKGFDEIGALFADLMSKYDLTSATLDRVVADADYVVAMAKMNTLGSSPYVVWITEWWKLQDGKVVEVRPYYLDTQELNAVLAAS